MIKTKFDSYYVDIYGNIYSDFKTSRKKLPIGEYKKLKCTPDSTGYRKVIINGKKYLLHRIVYETFYPYFDKSTLVLHKDGNKLNNSIENLYHGSYSDNSKDALKHGVCSRSKLNENQVKKILELSNLRVNELSKMFDVSRWTISRILKGKTWEYITKGDV